VAKYINKQSTILGALEEANGIVEELKDELQNWLDNLPDSFREGDKGTELEEEIEKLESAISSLEEAQSVISDTPLLSDHSFEYQQITFARSEYMSRAKRLQEGTEALNYLPSVLDNFNSDDWTDDQVQALEDLCSAVDEATSYLSDVQFPAAR
jgi:hypothetical protein